jgi:2-oxoglutarate ferredoxin oxidoreductase subunit alpha
MVEDVRLAVEGRVPVQFHGRMGGIIPSPDEVVEALERLVTPGVAQHAEAY